MRRRQVLALSIAAVAGCTGSNTAGGGPDDTTTSPVESTGTTTTTTSPTTTVEPCSTDLVAENPPEKPPNLSAAAESVVTDVEEPIIRRHLAPTDYLHFIVYEVDRVETEEGIRVDATFEVDYSSSGDGENATTVHGHMFYDVTYRLTDRRVVRTAAEQGPTGTVVCW